MGCESVWESMLGQIDAAVQSGVMLIPLYVGQVAGMGWWDHTLILKDTTFAASQEAKQVLRCLRGV